MNQIRKAKGRDDLVHLLRQVHRTDIRQVVEKVAVTEVLKANQTHWEKSVRESEQSTLKKLLKKENCQREIQKIIGMFPNVENSFPEQEASLGTSVFTHSLSC